MTLVFRIDKKGTKSVIGQLWRSIVHMLARKFYSGSIIATLLLVVSACGGSESNSNESPGGEPAVPAAEDEANAPATETDTVAVIDAEIVPASEVDAATNPDTAPAEGESAGDAVNGRRLFGRCMACHTVQEGRHLNGPSLYGIIGRPAGSIDGFRYSDANENSGIVWTEETMSAFLENPQSYMPGTRMIYPGIPSEQDRRDIIAYLSSVVE